MQTLPKKILVLRFSAMGDVAMTVPVITSFEINAQAEMLVVTNKLFAPMFSELKNTKVFPIDLKNKHKGFAGIFRLFIELKKFKPDAVADLHDVLRTKLLRAFFFFVGVKSSVINKGRAEKKNLIAKGKDNSVQLKTSFERYKNVFENLGFNFDIDFESIFKNKPDLCQPLLDLYGDKRAKWIGIAPFAKHKGKLYPLVKMEKVIEALNGETSLKIFLFGQGKEERDVMQQWEAKYENTCSASPSLGLKEELILMANLDLMLSMDSANMHLASLVGQRVLSIWGATHHFAGFLGWKQKEDDIIGSAIQCRPCSVFGNKECKTNDYACLSGIEPNTVFSGIMKRLK